MNYITTMKQDNFAVNLKRLMDLHNLGPTEVGEIAHTDRQNVYLWLKGGGISEPRLERLAKHFETTKSELRYGSGTINRDVLQQILAAVDLAETRLGIHLGSDKKAALVGILYERYWKNGEPSEKELDDLMQLSA